MKKWMIVLVGCLLLAGVSIGTANEEEDEILWCEDTEGTEELNPPECSDPINPCCQTALQAWYLCMANGGFIMICDSYAVAVYAECTNGEEE